MKRTARARRVLAGATDPRLLEATPQVALLALTTFIHLASSIDLESSDFHIRIPLAVISMIPAVLLFWCAHYVANKFRLNRTVVVLTSYAVGGALRGWILEQGLNSFGLLPDLSAYRLLSGIIIVFSAAGSISYAWSTISDARNAIVSLYRQTESLQQTMQEVADEVGARDLEQTVAMGRQITNELLALTRDISGFDRGKLEHLVHQVVRPLSRELAPTTDLHQKIVVTEPQVSLRRVLNMLDPIRHLPSPGTAGTALTLAAAAPVISLYGWRTATTLVMLLVPSLAVSVYLLYPLGRKTLSNIRSPFQELLITVGFVAVALLPAYATTIALADTPNPQAYVLSGIITIPVFGWIAVIGKAAWEYSQNVQVELATTRDQLRWSIARLNVLSWYHRGLIARLLHGPVQNSLQVALMQIQSGDQDGGSPEIIHDVIERIDQAITDATNATQSAKSDLLGMEDALNSWRSIAEVQLVRDNEVESALMQDPAGCAILADIIIETCSNAIRHGGATTLRFDHHLTQAGVELRLIDNGTWNKSVTISGLGTELMSSCAITLTRTHDHGANELIIELPLGNQPPQPPRVLRPAS